MKKIYEQVRDADFGIWNKTEIYKKRNGGYLVIELSHDAPDPLKKGVRNYKTMQDIKMYCEVNTLDFDILKFETKEQGAKNKMKAMIKIKDSETGNDIYATVIQQKDIKDGVFFVVEAKGNQFTVIEHDDGTIVSQHDWQSKPVKTEEIQADFVKWVDVTPIKKEAL